MKKQIILLTCLLLLDLAPVFPAEARSVTGDPTPIHVTNGNDDGPGSLRATIQDAGPAATIDFTFTGTVLLTSGELLVDKDLTISGPGSAILTISRDPNSAASAYTAIVRGANGTTGVALVEAYLLP